jgi:hypothetical protein
LRKTSGIECFSSWKKLKSIPILEKRFKNAKKAMEDSKENYL